jgi:hypothetical protein
MKSGYPVQRGLGRLELGYLCYLMGLYGLSPCHHIDTEPIPWSLSGILTPVVTDTFQQPLRAHKSHSLILVAGFLERSDMNNYLNKIPKEKQLSREISSTPEQRYCPSLIT